MTPRSLSRSRAKALCTAALLAACGVPSGESALPSAPAVHAAPSELASPSEAAELAATGPAPEPEPATQAAATPGAGSEAERKPVPRRKKPRVRGKKSGGR